MERGQLSSPLSYYRNLNKRSGEDSLALMGLQRLNTVQEVQEGSPVRGILSAPEKTSRKQDPCDLFFQKQELFLGCVFVLLPGVANRNEFFSDYSQRPAFVIYVPL